MNLKRTPLKIVPEECGCDGAPEQEKRVIVIKIGKAEPDDKDSGKKVLEKKEPVEEAKKHKIKSPFIKRCVAAITKGKPSSKEELSGAFAKCVSTEKKHSGPSLDKSARERPGYKARKAQFVAALKYNKK